MTSHSSTVNAIDDDPDTPIDNSTENVVFAKNLTKTYHGQRQVTAIDNVSLQLQPGEFVAIRGASGSGKTTLLLTIGTLLKPDSGDVRLFGQSPYEMSNNERAQFRAETVGFVFQQFHLVPYLNVLDNIRAPLLTNTKISSDEAIHWMEKFGLSERANHFASQLSSGERQRCALARALVTRPKLLLADEPTGNLDEDNANIVMQTLNEFAQSGGAVLLVTHDQRNTNLAHRTLKMVSGQILSEDSERVESN